MKPRSRHDPPPIWQRGRLQRWFQFFSREIWMIELAGVPRFRALLLRISRVLILTARGFHSDRLMLQAAAMTYVTVLSIVPVLAVGFAFAKGLDVFDNLEQQTIQPFLDDLFGPATVETTAGPDGEGTETRASQLRYAADQILNTVRSTKTGALGGIGLLILLYTAIKLLGAVERALNEIWGVRSPRSWGRRISNYIAIMVVTPIFLFVGTAATTTLRAGRLGFLGDIGIGKILSLFLELAPVASICLGLSFLYLAMPNTNVRWRSALVGGVVAGLLWYVTQLFHFGMQVGVARLSVIYSSFAALPVFLVWIFVSWVVILIGAELGFAHQNVSLYTSIARTGTVDHALKESLALRLVGRIAEAFLGGEPPWTPTRFAKELGVSPRAVTLVLESLVDHGLLARTAEGSEDAYLPARDLDAISVLDVLHALKVEGEGARLPARGRLDERVDRILEGVDREIADSLHNYTLRELARAAREGAGEETTDGASQPREAGSPSEI